MIDPLAIGVKEVLSFVTGIIAAVAWFVRLEARTLSNKEDIYETNQRILYIEQQREKDMEVARVSQRQAQEAMTDLSNRVDSKFDRMQNTLEQILVRLGEKADRKSER